MQNRAERSAVKDSEITYGRLAACEHLFGYHFGDGFRHHSGTMLAAALAGSFVGTATRPVFGLAVEPTSNANRINGGTAENQGWE
jgi:hypothetical protein